MVLANHQLLRNARRRNKQTIITMQRGDSLATPNPHPTVPRRRRRRHQQALLLLLISPNSRTHLHQPRRMHHVGKFMLLPHYVVRITTTTATTMQFWSIPNLLLYSQEEVHLLLNLPKNYPIPNHHPWLIGYDLGHDLCYNHYYPLYHNTSLVVHSQHHHPCHLLHRLLNNVVPTQKNG